MGEITLSELLVLKEQRFSNQKRILDSGKCSCLVCLTINMPGNNKNNKMSRLFFSQGSAILCNALSGNVILAEGYKDKPSGPELYLGVNLSTEEAKAIAIKIEDSYPWTRMLDIDVIGKNYEPVSRKTPRKCLVCDRIAKDCARNQTHSYHEITNAVKELYRDCRCMIYGELAFKSLLTELNVTPKPGLIDKNNNGSHKDMNFATMFKSADTLRPWFYKMAKAQSFEELRNIGKTAESEMLKATCGINTHKGAVFCLGLLCYAAVNAPENMSGFLKRECSNLTDELKGKNTTKGEKAFVSYGLTGARGHAQNGYGIIFDFALPFYREKLKTEDENTALVHTLLALISKNDDTNIVLRSNPDTLREVQKICSENLNSDLKKIEETDRLFIEKNISPGGSADLLAATWFCFNALRHLEES